EKPSDLALASCSAFMPFKIKFGKANRNSPRLSRLNYNQGAKCSKFRNQKLQSKLINADYGQEIKEQKFKFVSKAQVCLYQRFLAQISGPTLKATNAGGNNVESMPPGRL